MFEEGPFRDEPLKAKVYTQDLYIHFVNHKSNIKDESCRKAGQTSEKGEEKCLHLALY